MRIPPHPSEHPANSRPTTNAPSIREQTPGAGSRHRRSSPIVKAAGRAPTQTVSPDAGPVPPLKTTVKPLVRSHSVRFRVAQGRMSQDGHARHGQPPAGHANPARLVLLRDGDSSLPTSRVFRHPTGIINVLRERENTRRCLSGARTWWVLHLGRKAELSSPGFPVPAWFMKEQ